MNMNHVHLGSLDVGKSKRFYEKHFNFKKKFDHGDGVFLVNDSNFLIAIDPVDDLPRFPDWYHLGFCLDKESDVHDLYAKLKGDDVEIAREMKEEPGSFASFFVLDPGGNKIEISWHKD